MNEIKIFTNEQFGQIRTITQNGEPWFAATDVCHALDVGNPSQAISRLDDDEKHTTLILNEGAASGKSQMSFVSESGLYSLVLGSRKPEAKAFKRWITHEVIPTIRRHGMYATPETAEKILQDPDFLIKTLQELKKERSARVAAEEQIRLDAPKVLFADCVSQADTDILVGELAKLLKQNGMDIGQNRLYEKLRAEGFIMKNSTIPTQRAMEMGLFRVIERSIMQPNGTTRITQTTKVTGKGQQYFVNRYIGRGGDS